MMSFEPNIIVIDDKYDEVVGIISYYQSNGSGCKFFNADTIEGDDMPETSFSDVNIIFLDLFLEGDKFDPEQCSNWVKSLIPEKSFYLLIIWSKDPSHADEVIENLKIVNRSPFAFFIENKTDYPSQTDEKYNFDRLFEKLNVIINDIPALDEMAIWKKNIRTSSNEIIGYLTKDSNPKVFVNKLKKIIISHGGTSTITSKNDDLKRSILFDALDNVLISNTKKNLTDVEISALNKASLYNLGEIQNPEIDSELNSWFHFKLDKKLNKDLITPGLISVFEENSWKEMYSIHDDKIVSEFIVKQVGENVKIYSIVLLLSRPCDIAQNKYGKNLKLLSGLKIVNPIRKNNEKKEFQKGSSSVDSIKIYDHLYIDDTEKDVTFLFDFRYNFSVPEEIFKSVFNNLIIFNKELLSEIQVEYSSYSSRLGITQVI
jgi:hypothetical protein